LACRPLSPPAAFAMRDTPVDMSAGNGLRRVAWFQARRLPATRMMILAQALAEYGATAALAEGLGHLSLQLGNTLGEWRTEAIVAVAVAAVLWRVVTATR
jgi:hypothetical protein